MPMYPSKNQNAFTLYHKMIKKKIIMDSQQLTVMFY